MVLKDFLRILRRRFLWFFATLVLTGAGLSYATQIEKPYYVSSVAVQMTKPEPVSLVGRSPIELIHPSTIATWMDQITSRKMYAIVEDGVEMDTGEGMIKLGPYLKREQLKTLRDTKFDRKVDVSQKPQTKILLITASGADKESAIAQAQAYAEAARDYSQFVANKDIRGSKIQADLAIKRKRKQVELLRKEKGDLVNNTRDDLPILHQRLFKDHMDVLDRINDMRRQLDSNHQRIENLRQDRARLTALRSETPPRIPQDLRARAMLTSTIRKLELELAEMEKNLTAMKETRTKHHPEYQKMLSEYTDRKVHLSEQISEVARRNLEEEELKLAETNDNIKIEMNILKKQKTALEDDKVKLQDKIREYQRKDDSLNQELKLIDQIATMLGRLEGIGEIKGYIQLEEEEFSQYAAPTPPKSRNMIYLAILVAFLMAGGVAYMREQFDTQIRSDYDVKRHLNLPVLRAIRKEKNADDRLLLRAARHAPLAESFDTLITMVRSLAGDKEIKTLTIVSPKPEEGKTTVSINTAVAAARQGRRVLLVDADMQRPMIDKMMGLQNSMGFSNLIAAEGNLSEEDSQRMYQLSSVENLTVITSGPNPENPYALLEPTNLKPIVEGLQMHFDLIVFDTPPLLLKGDAVKLAGISDATVLVIGAYDTEHREAITAKHLLENVNARILGVVLNKASQESEHYYYYYSGYYGYSKSVRT